MALNPGNIECTSGLAREIHEFMIMTKEAGGMGATDYVEKPVIDPVTGEDTGEIELGDDTLLRRLCYNLSNIIINHIKNNLEVNDIKVEVTEGAQGMVTEVTGDCSIKIGGTEYTGTFSGTGEQSNTAVGTQINGTENVK